MIFFIALVSRSVTAPRSWMPWLAWTWCGSSLSLWLTWMTGRNGAFATALPIGYEFLKKIQSWQEGPGFQYADLFFSFVYVLEVWESGKRWSKFWSVQAWCCRDMLWCKAVLKLCHWSWAEYWYHGDNRPWHCHCSAPLWIYGILTLKE